MSLAAIVRALVQSGATPQMILAAVEADENARLEKSALERESARQRKIKSRNNKIHVTVTPVTDCDTRDKKAPPFVPPFDGFPDPSLNPPLNTPPKKPIAQVVFPSWMPMAEWNGFEEMRKKIKKPMTDNARRLAIGKLERFRAQGHDPTEILNQSIFNDYQDLYEPKDKNNANTRGNTTNKSWTSAGNQLAERYRLEAEREEQAAAIDPARASLRLTEGIRQD